MICCVECFKDSELRAIIESFKVIGDCEVCGHKKVFIYDTATNNRLTELLEGLIEIYTPISDMSEELQENRADFSLLKDALHEDWNIFNIDRSKAYMLIKEICKNKYKENPKHFEEAVGISRMYDEEFKEEFSILKNSTWDAFTNEIRHQNRYHVKLFNEKIFEEIIGYASTSYEQGQLFFRARISTEHDEKYPTNEMGPPPKGKGSTGRINPKGISCLYLGSSEDISIKEVRARMHDSVTIGRFELLKKIEVIDLTKIDKFSPFLGNDLGFDYEKYAVNNEHLRNIAKEFLIPSKRNDPDLAYLPSQYIAEFIKSKGKKGIKYESTMDSKGYNIVVFDAKLLECKETEFLEIVNIHYDKQ